MSTSEVRFSDGALLWLYRAAYARMKKAQRGIDKFTPKAGYSEQETAEFLDKKLKTVEFGQEVLDQIEAELHRRGRGDLLARNGTT